MSLPLGAVQLKEIQDCRILKTDPPETYTFESVVHYSPPTYTEMALKDVFSTNDPPEDMQLWDYHYDLMNDFAWYHRERPDIPSTPNPWLYKRFPRKFKFRFAKFTSTIAGGTVNVGPWKEVEFAAVIVPHFKSFSLDGLVPEGDPAPARLWEGGGQPTDDIGRTGDVYFDMDTEVDGSAQKYGPKVAIPGDNNTPQDPSRGTWVIGPIPPGLANIETTRAQSQFRKYKSKEGQIWAGPHLVQRSLNVSDGFYFPPSSPVQIYINTRRPWGNYVPRWPSVVDWVPPSAAGLVKTAIIVLPLFKPGTGIQNAFPIWTPAYDQPVWSEYTYATTVRVGDYRYDTQEIGTGNLPWPPQNRTESAMPTFGTWVRYKSSPTTAPEPAFGQALAYIKDDSHFPIGGREPIPISFINPWWYEQINPVPVDPFYFDPEHPDGEYTPDGFPGFGFGNGRPCTGDYHSYVGPNLQTESYQIQSTLIPED